MYQRIATIVAGLIVAVFVTGCVMPDQMSQIQKDLADVKAQLAELRREQASVERQVDTSSAVVAGRDAADLASREQLADVDARVQQAARNAEINEERLGDLQRQVERLMRELDETRDMALRGAMMVPAGPTGPGDPSRTDGSATQRGAEPYPARLSAGGVTPGGDPDELYNTAYADFSKGNYELAVAGFEGFYEQFPRSAVADNALYWIGECYFSQGDFPLAIRAFDRMLETFPDSDKVAAGNLKKGLAYLEQNQVRQAIVQLQHVYKAYGGSDEAKVARDKLTALGAPI